MEIKSQKIITEERRKTMKNIVIAILAIIAFVESLTIAWSLGGGMVICMSRNPGKTMEDFMRNGSK